MLLSSAYFAVICYFPLRTPAAKLFTTFGYGYGTGAHLFARTILQ